MVFSKPRPIVVSSALLFTIVVLVLGYVLLGIYPTLLFALGFVGGFILWLAIPTAAPFAAIRAPFYATLVFFVLHKIEERYFDFFPALSAITGVPVPDTSSPFVFLLYAFAGAWLLIPFLIRRQYSFGYYLLWTFFTSMGVIEVAHFIFPVFREGPYGYFPGMMTVTVLAPTAWWGIATLLSARVNYNPLPPAN
jgi:hypothetical protein